MTDNPTRTRTETAVKKQQWNYTPHIFGGSPVKSASFRYLEVHITVNVTWIHYIKQIQTMIALPVPPAEKFIDLDNTGVIESLLTLSAAQCGTGSSVCSCEVVCL